MDRYKIGPVLGEGTFGIVYKAFDKKNQDAIVAIKQYKRGKFKDGVNFTALREIKLQQELLNHANITQLIDVFIHQEALNLVLEFLPTNLQDLIMCKKVAFKEADIKAYMK